MLRASEKSLGDGFGSPRNCSTSLSSVVGGDDEGGQILERRIGLAEIDRRRAFDVDDTQRAIGVESPDFFLRPVVGFAASRGTTSARRARDRTDCTCHSPGSTCTLSCAVGVEARREVARRWRSVRSPPASRPAARRSDGCRRPTDRRRCQHHRHAVVDAPVHAHRQANRSALRVARAGRFAEPQPFAVDQRLRDRRAVERQLQQAVLARQRNRVGHFVPGERAVQAVATRREVHARAIVEPRHDRGPAVRAHVASATDRRRPATSRRRRRTPRRRSVKRPPACVRSRFSVLIHTHGRSCTVVVAGRTLQLRVAVEHPAAPRLEHRRNVRVRRAREPPLAPTRNGAIRTSSVSQPSRRRFMQRPRRKKARRFFHFTDACTGDVEKRAWLRATIRRSRGNNS